MTNGIMRPSGYNSGYEDGYAAGLQYAKDNLSVYLTFRVSHDDSPLNPSYKTLKYGVGGSISGSYTTGGDPETVSSTCSVEWKLAGETISG